jgi:hypothetical protein
VVFVISLIVAGGSCIDSCVVNWLRGTDDGVGDGFVDGFVLIVFRYFRWSLITGCGSSSSLGPVSIIASVCTSVLGLLYCF